MRLSENNGLVYVLKPGDHQAGVDGDSFSMKNFRHFCIDLLTAVLTGDAVLKIFSGATAGTKTTAETFHYRLADAEQGVDEADTFGAWTDSAALTLTAATYDNKQLIIEMDGAELTDAQPWITMEIGAESSAFNAAAVAVLSEPRYSAHDMPTAIA